MTGYIQHTRKIGSITNESAEIGDVPRLRGVLFKEIGISILINIAFNLTFALLLFGTGARIPLWGHAGIAVDLLPATFMPALMMTFGITLGIQRRVRLGKLMPSFPSFPLPPLPRFLALRALAIALLAVMIIVPPVVGVIALSSTRPWGWGTFVAFKLAFSVVHAALVTPVVVMSALRCR